ncbi:autotransporter outer membrane beta-barrel domain-containing protein, partial [Salmonella enterica]
RRTWRCLAVLMACSFFINSTYCLQVVYISVAAPVHRTELYTCDSDKLSNYKDLLAERIHSTQYTVVTVLSLADVTPLDATRGI